MKHKKRKSGHRTADQMYAHISRWEASGQSQKSYITEHGLSKSVFGYWLRRYRQEKQSGFVAVEASAAFPGDQREIFARIQTVQGTELILYEAVSAAWLRELLW